MQKKVYFCSGFKTFISMKKILTIALMALMVLPAWAGKTPKKWNFQLNDEGECVIERTYSTSKDAASALKGVKAAINKQTFEDRKIVSQSEDQIQYALKKNTKSRYNPFAGNFNEAMEFKMNVVYKEGKVVITINDLALENRYEGYGKNTTNDSFAGKISDYEEAVAKAISSKGKAKKEAEEVIENTNDSFNMCEEELEKIFSAIQQKL